MRPVVNQVINFSWPNRNHGALNSLCSGGQDDNTLKDFFYPVYLITQENRSLTAVIKTLFIKEKKTIVDLLIYFVRLVFYYNVTQVIQLAIITAYHHVVCSFFVVVVVFTALKYQ